MSATCLVVMGVTGSGKSTVAKLLADRLDWPFTEGDELHPAGNIAKMTAGVPLTDADREPWLRIIRDRIGAEAAKGHSSVFTCSALRRAYRDVLREADARVRFVHLDGSRELIGGRLGRRSGHFMPPRLLDSQFAALEPLGPDEDGVVVNVADTPEVIADEVLAFLGH
ncbi:gluconokinase [Glycomyces sp. NPDC047010]|uniref:gluconokinase n=1 Tax=Glycomyces sp. NPDC047010 TaxID=3155023 RepID=UPI0033CDE71E